MRAPCAALPRLRACRTYARPPLSKALWKGEAENTIWRGTEELGVDLRLGRRIVGLDLGERAAADAEGERYHYERLLLATGGRPRQLPFGDDVIYFRTLDDFRRLRTLADRGSQFVVTGGGFIGSEIAAALALNGCGDDGFPEPGIAARIFPAELSTRLNDYYRNRGVELLPGASVATLEADAVVPESGSSRTWSSPLRWVCRSQTASSRMLSAGTTARTTR